MEFFYWLQEYECRNRDFIASAEKINMIFKGVIGSDFQGGEFPKEYHDCLDKHYSTYYTPPCITPTSPSSLCKEIEKGNQFWPRLPRKYPLTKVYADVWQDTGDDSLKGKLVLKIDLDGPLEVIIEQVNEIATIAWQNKGEYIHPYDIYSAISPLENARYIKEKGGFSPSSKKARAAGLWLWDRVQALGGVPGAAAQAIREFGESEDINALGLLDGKATDTEFRFYLRRTAACIEKPGVLSFSKKGTRMSRRVPGTHKRI